jgi:hypothetical protein
MVISAVMVTTPSETAVRNYLTFLSDPDRLVDQAAVKKLQANVEKAKDPVDKLRAISKLETARKADPDVYRRGFVENAKAWAEDEGVPGSAFERMGVPQDVLRDAGLAPRARRGRSKAPRAARAPRRRSMKAGDIEAGIVILEEPFTVRDVADKVGGSPLTIKAALDRLEAQGRIRPAGERSGGRGRASKVWTVAMEPVQ